jgi:hypothetical protein
MRVPVHLSFNITLPFVYLKRKTNSVGRNKKKNSRVNISLNVSDIIYVGMSQFKQSRENQQKKWKLNKQAVGRSRRPFDIQIQLVADFRKILAASRHQRA